ncbi:MAG: hypothetical protein L0Y38_04055 [Methylococcaceae bacterium]|nr:hypothetical protein [Methylococcaceae bacterium]MCI0668281.1 hypothetical protein [Methylococcaceae bacterium]MCI0732983.1 hypothetical protein [Methylococcaceae bacterium]
MGTRNLRATRIRIFITCWIIFALFFATDFVREHYLVLSIGDHFSFRLDGFEGLHPDIFVTENHGVHHGANPGASMIAAIPYAVFKPLIDAINNRILSKRSAAAGEIIAVYKDPRPMRVEFFKQVRQRGLDIKFGLTGFVTQVFCMAPLSAFSVVVMFNVFIWLGMNHKLSRGLAFLYAFGTPVLFRTAYLNQNLMVGIFSLFAFVLIWRSSEELRLTLKTRYFLAGFFGGLGFLCDYSGAIPMALLGIYCLMLRNERVGIVEGLKDSLWYGAGTLLPVLLLGWYQYRSFGNFFYPGQHYMPQVEWIEVGYQGVGGPQLELLWMLWFDPRFGLFMVGPILLLALAAPLLPKDTQCALPLRETMTLVAIFLAVSIFFSSVQYTRLQWNTGIRYLMAIVPLTFILSGIVLARIPKLIAFPLVVLVIGESVAIAMVRSQSGIFDSVMRTFLEGFQLPWLGTLSRMAVQYAPFLDGQPASAIPFMTLAAVLIWGIWTIEEPGKPFDITSKPERLQSG